MPSPSTVGPRSVRQVSFGVALMGRLLVCSLAILVFALGFQTEATYAMILLALIGLRTLSLRSEAETLITIVISLKILWLGVAILSYATELPTLFQSENRSFTRQSANMGAIVFFASQMVFLLSLCSYRLAEGDLRRAENPVAAFAFFSIALMSSYVINGTSFIGEEVYSGNVQSYWGGLSLIFTVALAGYLLTMRADSLAALVLTNLLFLYWLSTGNRSEILVAFVAVNAYFFLRRLDIRRDWLRFAVLIGAGLLSFWLFSLISVIRSLALSRDSNLLLIVFGNIIQPEQIHVSTVGSSIYSALAAYSISNTSGYELGSHYIGQLLNTIPSFIPTPWERYLDLYFKYYDRYDLIGGFGLMGESILNFGYFGPSVVGAAFVLLFRAIANSSRNSFFASWFLVAFCFMAQRYFYYGYVYMHNLLTLFVVMGIALMVLRSLARK